MNFRRNDCFTLIEEIILRRHTLVTTRKLEVEGHVGGSRKNSKERSGYAEHCILCLIKIKLIRKGNILIKLGYYGNKFICKILKELLRKILNKFRKNLKFLPKKQWIFLISEKANFFKEWFHLIFFHNFK